MSGWLATVKNWATMPPTPLPVGGVEPPAGTSMFARLAGLFNFTSTTEGDNLKVKCRDLFRMDTGKLCEAETVVVRSDKVATSHAVTHLRNVHQYALYPSERKATKEEEAAAAEDVSAEVAHPVAAITKVTRSEARAGRWTLKIK